VTVDYGQPHIREIYAAARLAEACNVKNIRLTLDSVYRGCKDGLFSGQDKVAASTVVPLRNMLLITASAAVAEAQGCDTVVVGSNADDFVDYPDCRKSFIDSINATLQASGSPVTVMAPLLRMTKRGVVDKAKQLGVPIEATLSCYRGDGCGECAACKLREASL
jgi:7-cyano-7-deazaguanine synthase